MRNSLVVFALLSIPTITLAGKKTPAGNKMTPGSYPEKASAWKRFTVKDVQPGAAVDKVAGFTCDSDIGKYRHTCAQFFDEKCKGLPTYVKQVTRVSPAPSQGCTYDTNNGGTYLNGQYVSTPLINVSIVGTDTDVPRAYEIRYVFTKDALVEGSKVTKALIAKYGQPDYTNPPLQLRWQVAGMDNDLYLEAECTTEGNTAHCLLEAHDGPFLDAERGIKKAFEDAKARQEAPEPAL